MFTCPGDLFLLWLNWPVQISRARLCCQNVIPQVWFYNPFWTAMTYPAQDPYNGIVHLWQQFNSLYSLLIDSANIPLHWISQAFPTWLILRAEIFDIKFRKIKPHSSWQLKWKIKLKKKLLLDHKEKKIVIYIGTKFVIRTICLLFSVSNALSQPPNSIAFTSKKNKYF